MSPLLVAVVLFAPHQPAGGDDVPEVKSNGSNHTRATAQPVPVPCVVVGTATADAGDCFRVPVKAGRPLALDVFARRAGSSLDPVLLIADGAGKDLAGLAVDDTPGLKGDARVRFVPNADGEVVVEVRDTLFRGGPEFGYRLRVGDFPAVSTVFPLAVQRGKEATFEFVGPGAEGVLPVTATGPTGPKVTSVPVAPRRPGGTAGWPVPVPVSDHPEAVEAEPNDDPAAATRVPVPGGVSAQFAAKGDRDTFVFAAKKGAKLLVRATGAEVRLRVLGPNGTAVGTSDPAKAEAAVEFTPAADGDYRAVCDALNYAAGPAEVYHLTVAPAPEKPAEKPVEKKKK